MSIEFARPASMSMKGSLPRFFSPSVAAVSLAVGVWTAFSLATESGPALLAGALAAAVGYVFVTVLVSRVEAS